MKNRAGQTLHLEAAGEKGRLKIGVHKPDDVIWSYRDISVPMEKIETRCREMADISTRSGRKGGGDPHMARKLREMGRMLGDALLTPDLKEDIRRTRAENLVLRLDDHLVHIPWELLCIEERLLCQRFNMGRVVKTRQKTTESNRRAISMPMKMWILANPGGDLTGAGAEALRICDRLDRMNSARVNRNGAVIEASVDSDITPDAIKERIRNYDIVHFAGHADYDGENPGQSGWKLADGNLFARDIHKMAGGAAMPALVFSNACQSARTEAWETSNAMQGDPFGLANAFMLAGARHYVGAFREIIDEPSGLFATRFYDHLLSGRPIGEAVRLARLDLAERYGPGFIGWASYLLYGDPACSYFAVGEKPDKKEALEHPLHSTPREPSTLPRQGEAPARGKSTHVTKSRRWSKPDRIRWIALACLGVVVLALTWMAVYRSFTSDASARRLDPETLTMLEERAGQKRERIDRLYQELEKRTAARQKSTAEQKSSDASPPDNWTSSPLTLAMDFDSVRSFQNRGKENLISSLIGNQLIEHTPVTLLERIHLDALLEELSRGASELLPPENRLSPRLLAARFILFLEVYDSDAESVVMMHLSDTRERRVVISLIAPLPPGEPIAARKQDLARELVEKLKTLYPLRGVILVPADDGFRINIGNKQGVRIGQRFKVIGKEIILKAVSIRPGSCVVRLEKGNFPLEKGWHVEGM